MVFHSRTKNSMKKDSNDLAPDKMDDDKEERQSVCMCVCVNE